MLPILGHQSHPIGNNPPNGGRFQVVDDHNKFSNQVRRSVMEGDPGNNLLLDPSGVNFEDQKPIRVRMEIGFQNLGHLQLKLPELIDRRYEKTPCFLVVEK